MHQIKNSNNYNPITIKLTKIFKRLIVFWWDTSLQCPIKSLPHWRRSQFEKVDFGTKSQFDKMNI